jgi:hypothetical protein
MAFEGSCHCGTVAFAVDGDPPTGAMSCNCSHCRRKGFLLAFVPAERFRLLRGEDSLTDYRFHKHAITHRFCRECGTQPYAEGKMPDGSPTRAVNLRCVETVDLDSLDVQRVDGASF